MPPYKFIKLMLVALVGFFIGRDYMGISDCLCVLFLRFFMIWTIGVRDKWSVVLNCNIGQWQKTTEGLATPVLTLIRLLGSKLTPRQVNLQ